MTKQETVKVLARLGAAYRLEVEPDQIVVWAEVLAPLPSHAVEEAVLGWIRTQPRFPTPALLIDATQGVLRRQREERPQIAEESEGQPVDSKTAAENVRKIRSMLRQVGKSA